MSPDLPCHRCGYDLRAHPPDGQCPECAAPVAESRRLAAIPRRPAWRDSDPRWRRRMLAGVWILTLMPLMNAAQHFGWAERVRAPNVFGFPGVIRTLSETLLCYGSVYQPLIFCMGVVLLFSNERGRRPGRLDWTRRWGVLCSYVVLLLSSVEVLFLGSLVTVGIAASFLSIALKFQPAMTPWLANASSFYILYGPHPKPIVSNVQVAFSSITILLACAPLFDALRSSSAKGRAAILLAPLPLFALIYLVQLIRHYSLVFSAGAPDLFYYGVYFWPDILFADASRRPPIFSGSMQIAFIVELTKWCTILAIAFGLTLAQFTARRERNNEQKRPSPKEEQKSPASH